MRSFPPGALTAETFANRRLRVQMCSLVRQLFKLAREKKPAIIFIDEIDALCSNREGGGGRSNEDTARMKTEFLVQMDGVGNDNTGVLLLAATNLPWALDPAVRRRFQKRIHIPLPDAAARKQLFKVHIGDLAKALSERDFDELARRTEGLSGSDIANAVQDALMVPIKTVYAAKYFRKVRRDTRISFFPLFIFCYHYESGARAEAYTRLSLGLRGSVGVVHALRRAGPRGSIHDVEAGAGEAAERAGLGRGRLFQSSRRRQAHRRGGRHSEVPRMDGAVWAGGRIRGKARDGKTEPRRDCSMLI